MHILRVGALASLLALAACAVRPAATTEGAQRIVSLIPSLTEDLFAIGAGPQVVGVSAFTDYPPEAKRLPVVASFGAVDAERIVQLRPDVVVGIAAQDALASDVRKTGVKTVLFHDDTYDDIFRDLQGLGALSGHAGAAGALIATLRAKTLTLQASVPKRKRRPTVFVVLGTGPIYTVGASSYIAKLIEIAGGANAAGDVREAYARYSAEALLARQPDALVVDPATNLAAVVDRAPWNGLRAVREHRVFTLPEPGILERPGPRYVEGLRWLIERLKSVPA